MINLIDQQSEFNYELTQYPTATLTLSILGTQSSGKSTLLNHLFDTAFPILDTTQSRDRCTKGVWLQHVNNYNILDTQGFDSSDRSEDQKLFQKQISLFCVLVSDIILINVFMNEIGRYSGGHIDILDALLVVGERLASPQQKKIIYVIRDFTEEADHRILQQQISIQVKKLTDKHKNTQLKFSFEYFFMSNYVYHPQNFISQAKILLPLISIRKSSTINNYKQEDRVKYLIQLWDKIRDSKNQVDLKSIDYALKIYVLQRIKTEILSLLQQTLKNMNTLYEVKSFEHYVEKLKKQSLSYLKENRPKHIKEAELQPHNLKIFQLFEPIAIKHFNTVILKNVQTSLQKSLQDEIQKHSENKTLSHLIVKKKKQITQTYKKVIYKHKQYSFLLKNFNQKISDIIGKEERKLNHLFSEFQTYSETELNKLLDKQVQKLIFKGRQFTQKMEALCQQYKYNQWEVDFKQIWEKVCYRCIDKKLPQILANKSQNSCKQIGIFSGDQTTDIIAYHTQLQKRALDFCRQIMYFKHEESIITQPLSQIKEVVSECLSKRLTFEQRRWKISLLIVSLLLFLLYKQFQVLLSCFSLKKKKVKFLSRIYFWGSLTLLFFSFFNQFVIKRRAQSAKLKQ